MLREDLWNMLYTAVAADFGVVAADENLQTLLDPLKKELGRSRQDDIDSAINFLTGEMMKAAFAFGWKCAKQPELLIFEDGSTADPA